MLLNKELFFSLPSLKKDLGFTGATLLLLKRLKLLPLKMLEESLGFEKSRGLSFLGFLGAFFSLKTTYLLSSVDHCRTMKIQIVGVEKVVAGYPSD